MYKKNVVRYGVILLMITAHITALSMDIWTQIGGNSNDQVRDCLMQTCHLFHRNFSIKSPNLINMLSVSTFNTSEKNMQWLAFDTAHKGDHNLLKALLKHMKQSDYIYTYSFRNVFADFPLGHVVALKMPGCYDDLAAIAKKYDANLDGGRQSSHCDDLRIAFYGKDSKKAEELLDKNPTERHFFRSLLCMGMSRDDNTCIEVMLLHLKKNANSSGASYTMRNKLIDFQQFLTLAMREQKYETFESIVRIDPFDCLNQEYPSNQQKMCTLDWLIFKIEQNKIVNGKKYEDIYRKHGGLTWYENNPCVVQ